MAGAPSSSSSSVVVVGRGEAMLGALFFGALGGECTRSPCVAGGRSPISINKNTKSEAACVGGPQRNDAPPQMMKRKWKEGRLY